MPETYRTLARRGAHETEVNRSRFLCDLAPVASEEEAAGFLREVRAAYPDASHHCFAWVIGADASVQKAGDDGEPGGTAGVPMLQMLLRRDVRYAAAVVTRYFGGVKLGAGGLIRAYGGAVGAALDAVGTEVRRRCLLVTVGAGHTYAGRLHNDLVAAGHAVRDVRYGAEVTMDVALPGDGIDAFRAWLADATSGTATAVVGGETYAAEQSGRD